MHFTNMVNVRIMEWVSVGTISPPQDHPVLISYEGRISVGDFSGNTCYDVLMAYVEVKPTYWMEWPTPAP